MAEHLGGSRGREGSGSGTPLSFTRREGECICFSWSIIFSSLTAWVSMCTFA